MLWLRLAALFPRSRHSTTHHMKAVHAIHGILLIEKATDKVVLLLVLNLKVPKFSQSSSEISEYWTYFFACLFVPG